MSSYSKVGPNDNKYAGSGDFSKVPKRNDQNQIRAFTENYNGYIIPSSVDNAIFNRVSLKIGKPVDKKDLTEEEIKRRNDILRIQKSANDNFQKPICQSSGKEIYNNEIQLGVQTSDLQFLGATVPQYFDFIKFSIYILLILLLSSGFYNLLSNALLGADCFDEEEIDKMSSQMDVPASKFCKLDWITQSSLVNKRGNSSLVYLQDIMSLVSVAGVIVMFQYYRKHQTNLNIQLDFVEQGHDDFATLTFNLPSIGQKTIKQYITYIGDEIQTQINKTFQLKGKKMIKVAQDADGTPIINLVFNTTKIKDLENQKLEQIKILQNSYRNKYPDDKAQLAFENEMMNLDKKIKSECDRFTRVDTPLEEEIKNLYTKQAFVTFQTELMQDYVVSKCAGEETIYFQKTSEIQIDNCDVFFNEAPHPHDVMWDNLHYSPKENLIKRLKYRSLVLLILIFSSLIVFFLNILIIQIGGSFMEFLLALVITIINYVLIQFILNSSKNEGFSTRTDYHTAAATNAIFAMFLNSAGINLLVGVFGIHFVYGLDAATQSIYQSPGGIAHNQTHISIWMTFLPVIIELIDFKKLYRQYIQSKVTKTIQNEFLSQNELNDVFDYPRFDVSTRYAITMNLIFCSAIFAPLLPLTLFLAIIGLLCYYWVDQYKLLRHRSMKRQIAGELSTKMVEVMEFIIPIYCLGNTIFDAYVTRADGEPLNPSQYAVLGILIGIVHLLAPMDEFNKFACYLQESPGLIQIKDQELLDNIEDKYSQVKDQCVFAEYQSENPVSKFRRINNNYN